MAPLVQQIQASDLAMGSGMALLVFFAIALQCVSTLAILSKESGSASLAVKMFAGYFLFAYVAACWRVSTGEPVYLSAALVGALVLKQPAPAPVPAAPSSSPSARGFPCVYPPARH